MLIMLATIIISVMCTPLSTADMHDTRTRNRRRKNGVDLWCQFLDCLSVMGIRVAQQSSG